MLLLRPLKVLADLPALPGRVFDISMLYHWESSGRDLDELQQYFRILTELGGGRLYLWVDNLRADTQ